MNIQSREITLKSTGERVYYQVKRSWNRYYYSFDTGTTWHKSKSLAYAAARDSGSLHRVGEVKVVVAAQG